MVRLQGQLLLRLALIFLQLVDFRGKDGLRLCGRIHAVGLDRDHEPAAIFQEHRRIQGHNARLSCDVILPPLVWFLSPVLSLPQLSCHACRLMWWRAVALRDTIDHPFWVYRSEFSWSGLG